MAGRDLDAVLAAVDRLTAQVSRVAFAAETLVLNTIGVLSGRQCRGCGCRLIDVKDEACRVCGRPLEPEESNGGQAAE